jgi:hypothetical protein
MSRDVDLSKLSKWIGKARQIGEPPSLKEDARDSDGVARRDSIVQFNVKINASVKKRIKQLAARDDIQLGMMVARMVDLYEKEYGALTDTAGRRR